MLTNTRDRRVDCAFCRHLGASKLRPTQNICLSSWVTFRITSRFRFNVVSSAPSLLRLFGSGFYLNSLSIMNVARLARRPVKVTQSFTKQSIRCRSSRAASTCPMPSQKAGPSFPCVEAHAARESRILASSSKSTFAPRPQPTAPPNSGPEPPYARPSPSSYKVYHHSEPLALVYAPSLPEFDIAYETWGELTPARDNVILLHTGLSASSHAASSELNPSEGWWEKFIGPGRALDTNQFFIICTNVLGGCYGSTGPSSIDPLTGQPYATRFPVLSMFDMVRAQFCLLDHLGIESLYASVGSSMGAMQSLAAAWLYPERVGKVVSISGTARSSPSAIAMRYAQRSGEFLKKALGDSLRVKMNRI